MIAASEYFKTFSWKRIFPGKQPRPLLSESYDNDLWNNKTAFHLGAYQDFMQEVWEGYEGEPWLPVFLSHHDQDVMLNPLDESWLSLKLLRSVFGKLSELPKFGSEKRIEYISTGNPITDRSAWCFVMSIFYLAIFSGHTDISLARALRIDNTATYLHYRIGVLCSRHRVKILPNRARITRSIKSMKEMVTQRSQPVIEAYYRLPQEIRTTNLNKIAGEIEKDLAKTLKTPPHKTTIKRYLRKAGVRLSD